MNWKTTLIGSVLVAKGAFGLAANPKGILADVSKASQEVAEISSGLGLIFAADAKKKPEPIRLEDLKQ